MSKPAPELFSIPGDGKGQGAIWHAQTGQIASAANPALAAEALRMYTTSLIDGSVMPPQVAVGGRLAQVLYMGARQARNRTRQLHGIFPETGEFGPDLFDERPTLALVRIARECLGGLPVQTAKTEASRFLRSDYRGR